VLLTALRSPVHLAKSLSTLDHLSDGRLMVGVGLGGDRTAYLAYGYSADARVARFTEGLRLMQALWTEDRVTFDGRFFELRNATMAPKPKQRPHPPLWFGGHHPDALARAAGLGTGFIGAGVASTSEFAGQVRALGPALAKAGRDPATFAIGKRVYLAIDRDRARALSRLSEWFGAFYGRSELAAKVTVAGDVEECVDGLRAVVAAGAGFLILNPVFDEMDHLERLATEVARKL
jgi:alkanesulfonate monooxygenase SsuD/methylene tetrahydromethanopterin reductase-like flavin-dependent oxidoreductase (luciferase family)